MKMVRTHLTALLGMLLVLHVLHMLARMAVLPGMAMDLLRVWSLLRMLPGLVLLQVPLLLRDQLRIHAGQAALPKRTLA